MTLQSQVRIRSKEKYSDSRSIEGIITLSIRARDVPTLDCFTGSTKTHTLMPNHVLSVGTMGTPFPCGTRMIGANGSPSVS